MKHSIICLPSKTIHGPTFGRFKRFFFSRIARTCIFVCFLKHRNYAGGGGAFIEVRKNTHRKRRRRRRRRVMCAAARFVYNRVV